MNGGTRLARAGDGYRDNLYHDQFTCCTTHSLVGCFITSFFATVCVLSSVNHGSAECAPSTPVVIEAHEVAKMPPFAIPASRSEACYTQMSSQQRRGVHCGASPKAPRVNQTVARKVQVKPESDFANTRNRRYLFPTGDPFPLGPLFYRKTISKQVCGSS